MSLKTISVRLCNPPINENMIHNFYLHRQLLYFNPAGQVLLMNSTVPYIQQSLSISMVNERKSELQLIELD